MMEAVRTYLLRLTAGALCTSLAMAAVPKGAARKAAALVCSLAMLLLALGPLRAIDYDALAEAVGALELQKEQLRTGVEVQNRALIAELISARTESYILDKAASLGMTLSVSVQMDTAGKTPHACGVHYKGAATAAQRQALERYVDETFAITAERQVWEP